MTNEVNQVQLNILSVNIRGLNDRKKRRNLFRWVKKNKYDICFIQETYSSNEIENIWKNEWGGQIVFSHGSSHSRGVLILIKPGLDAKVVSVHSDNIGRFLLVDATIQDTQFKLVNIYAPNNDNDQLNFYHYIHRQINQNIHSGDKVLIGGDFNLIQDPEMDRKGGAPIIPTQKRNEIIKTLDDIKEHIGLKDIWRIRNPNTKRFTWRRNNPIIKSRLDYWLISETVEDSIKECDIIPFHHTDHSAVTLRVEGSSARTKGRGIWRLNTSFLTEELYIKGLMDKHEEWKKEFKEVQDPRMKWELMKYRIRQYSMKYGKEKARNIKNTETEIETKLKAIEQEQDKADAARATELENMKRELENKLEEITDYKTQGLILRSQTDWYEKGEKSTKYFLRLEKRNQIKKEMRRLQKDDGTFTVDQHEILGLQAEFYEALYKKRDSKSNAEMKLYLDGINTSVLSDSEKESCEGRLTAEECRATLKTFKLNKSPGNDGLPIEFYIKFWPIFSHNMLDSFNYAYEHGELSTSQRQAIVTLLDKGKDRTQLKNWRPISLLNSDYKIISKAIANRFTKYLSQLIPENQTGFIKGRNISDNLRTLSDIIYYLKDTKKPGILINIDFQKAFDSLNWEFMLLSLAKFNFGTSFIQWIKTLYNNISSCIINNGHTSKFFQVERGVRQGDPLSPYLFILVTEIMACKVRQESDIEGVVVKEKEIKMLQYADDTSCTLKNVKSAKCFLQTVKFFGQYSGLMLNVEKTEGMWLGSNHLNTTKPLGISWPDRPLKVLGIHFSYNEEACNKLNFTDKIDKAKRITNMWLGRNLTLYGRAQIIKTFVTSQFLYAASVIHTPREVINDINKLIFSFIWRNKKDKLKRTVLINKYEVGGLQVPDFQTMLNTTRLKWIQKIIKNCDSPWKLILEDYLERLDVSLQVLLYSNYNMKSTGLDKGTLPEFYRDLLTLWSEVGNTVPTDKANFIWHNKNICVNGRSLFYKDLFTAGIWYISDLFQANGEAVPFQTWVVRGVKRQSLIKWMGLVKKAMRDKGNYKAENDAPQQLSLLSKGSLSQMNSKAMYDQLLIQKVGPETVVPRIVKYLNNCDGINWKEIYVRARKYPMDTKTRAFQYSFIHDILTNKYWLNKWRMSETAICTYCNNNIEDTVHMFWTCDSTNEFWEQFISFCSIHGVLSSALNMEDIFLGVNDKRLCTLIFAAKRFIHNKRTHEEPLCFNAFKNILSNLKSMEFRIAKGNNRTDDWTEKWSFLP